MAESVWLLLLGFGTGTLGVMVGIGGGIVLVPVLLFATDMEPAVVAGTSLALVAVNSYAGSWTYRRMGLVDLRSGLLFSAAAAGCDPPHHHQRRRGLRLPLQRAAGDQRQRGTGVHLRLLWHRRRLPPDASAGDGLRLSSTGSSGHVGVRPDYLCHRGSSGPRLPWACRLVPDCAVGGCRAAGWRTDRRAAGREGPGFLDNASADLGARTHGRQAGV